MSATANIGTKFSGISQPVAAFWAARNSREQRMLSVAAGLVVLALIYLLLIDPALSGREQLSKTVPVLRQQVAELQTMAQLAASQSGQVAPPAAAVTRESLEASLLRKGLTPQSVTVSGNIARVQLTAASFSGLVAWLNEMQETARLSVSEANIVAQAQLDTVDANLTLQQRKND